MPLTMRLDDQEFTLSDESLMAMATSLARTRVKERGFSLCQDTEITPSFEHLGGRGSINERNCLGRPRVGYYHTHPTGPSRPSWWDAYSIVSASYRANSPSLGCRGAIEDGIIRCDTVKKAPDLVTVLELKGKRAAMRYTAAEDDPEIWRHFTEPHTIWARDILAPVEVPYPRYLVECDRQHTLDELKSMARTAEISPSGDKKELCRKLIGAGVIGSSACIRR